MNRIAIVFCILSALPAAAQAPVRKLPPIINHPSINVSAPYISADGNTLVYLSDYSEGGVLTVYFTQRTAGQWKQPVALPRHINTRLNFIRGYALSADGNTLFITSAKSGGVGGYDIWWGRLNSYSWNDLENMFKPINSPENEGCPSITPDGNTVYFMRCEKMDADKASGCRIMVSVKDNVGRWTEPQELPPYINTGNSQCPRIMADTETLIFSSDRQGPGKGGMDLYLTRLANGTWSKPVPLDFANTEGDDIYVSATSNGRYLLRDMTGKFKTELTELLFPEEVRPKGVMKIEGSVNGSDGNVPAAYVSVTDLSSGQRAYSVRPDPQGNFTLYLKAGTTYELAVDPAESHLTYYTEVIDLTGDANLNTRKISASIKPLKVGDELEPPGLAFKPYSSEPAHSEAALNRLARLLKNNPQFQYEIQVLLEGYQEDSVQSSPDLTEVVADTLRYKIADIDTLGQLYERDSLSVKVTWHNDRTARQAEQIIGQLTQLGVPAEALHPFTNARPEPDATLRRTRIRVAVRNKP
ncbi:MAG: hypothetical protein KatS3mg032_2014 [Cyclobacteriaceae bacterium]|nr:MAG: hypothetical protein KatS3mg032_2014 [Cyclobacteriaceae bacterium]